MDQGHVQRCSNTPICVGTNVCRSMTGLRNYIKNKKTIFIVETNHNRQIYNRPPASSYQKERQNIEEMNDEVSCW